MNVYCIPACVPMPHEARYRKTIIGLFLVYSQVSLVVGSCYHSNSIFTFEYRDDETVLCEITLGNYRQCFTNLDDHRYSA